MADVGDLMALATQIKKQYSAACKRVCDKYSLTQTEFDIIEYLSLKSPDNTAAHIAKQRQIEKANISTAVERLIEKELLIRVPDASDRRRIRLILTEKAERATREIEHAKEEFIKWLSSLLDEGELKEFVAILEKLKSSELKPSPAF